MAVTDLPTTSVYQVRALKESLRTLVAVLEPDGVFVFDAPELWAEFSELERLASAAKTLLARRVEEACTWRIEGYRSAAEQLAAVAGSSVSAAKAMLETSKQVDSLPATSDALRAGSLSSAKVEAIAAAAAIAPDAEERLLRLAAGAPLSEVRDECLRARAVDRDAAHARIRRERCAREYTDAEGAWNFRARGTPEDGARFRAAQGPIVDELFKAARADGHKEPYEAYAFDAFIELAGRATGEAIARKKVSPSFLALIRADLESLRRGSVEGDEKCEIAGLGPIPVRVARDLLGDAVLKLVITRGVDVVNVTHLGRSATVAQKVALWWQSPACEVEGCTRTLRLEIDHRDEWSKTRKTRLRKLDRLCGHHHDLKTYDGWALVAGTGSRPMVAPDDPRHPRYWPPP